MGKQTDTDSRPSGIIFDESPKFKLEIYVLRKLKMYLIYSATHLTFAYKVKILPGYNKLNWNCRWTIPNSSLNSPPVDTFCWKIPIDDCLSNQECIKVVQISHSYLPVVCGIEVTVFECLSCHVFQA